jgi:hypothetical protein
MIEVRSALWDQLVAVYEAADAEADAAYALYGEADPGAEGYDELEARHEELGRVRREHEAKLLAVRAPTVAAAAYQLRVYALSYQSADFAEPARSDEDREQTILRRIYESLQQLSEGLLAADRIET